MNKFCEMKWNSNPNPKVFGLYWVLDIYLKKINKIKLTDILI